MTAADRIRVLIAGNVYVKRALVRRFLEDDGYEVVGDAMAADAVLPALRAGRPDAIVLDEDLTRQGAPIAAIRETAPDVKVVVFTASAPGAGAPPPGADGYLDKGVGLAALTALLGRLFAEPTVLLKPLLVGAGVAAASATGDGVEVLMADTEQIPPVAPASTGRTGGGGRANLFRLVAMVAGGLLIVWGIFTAIDANQVGGGSETVAEPSTAIDTGGGGDIIAEPETTPLDDAYASLDRMVAALEGGNYILATVEAQSLMTQRDQAISGGFSTGGFDAEVTARLEALVPTLPRRVNTQLADILGNLYPAFEDTGRAGGGSDVVLGTTVTPDGGGSTSGGDTTGGDTTGGGGGGDGGQTEPQPGDGKEWGHSHKPPQGGWHGEKPK